MKIESINLSWFRGAGPKAVLKTDFKNMVVYGTNGAGKSTFSDALEYLVAKGKIKHLIHEYAGTRQEKGIINTNKPVDKKASIEISFDNKELVEANIDQDGTPHFKGNPDGILNTIQNWKLEQFILRQDEVAAFIVKRKGDKYSELLPLLGLEELETCADNTVKLRQQVEEKGQHTINKAKLAILKQDISNFFPDYTEKTAISTLKAIAHRYNTNNIPDQLQPLIETLEKTISEKVTVLTPEITRHTLIVQIQGTDAKSKLDAMNKADAAIIGKIDELLESHIQVLQYTSKYIEKFESEATEIECPACGRKIEKKEFDNHVRKELSKLDELRKARDESISKRQLLSEAIKQIIAISKESNIAEWLKLESQQKLNETLIELTTICGKNWDGNYTEEIRNICNRIIPFIVNQINIEAKYIPPANHTLINDSKIIDTAKKIKSARQLEKKIQMVGEIVAALEASEKTIRSQIKKLTQDKITKATSDIRLLWAKIHPNELIKDITLYMPEDADKSVDIALKFYGVEQLSPRLTLSEGHRNSLGLCIFLALAKLADDKTPIILDDIVSSLDRGHRANVIKLLLGVCPSKFFR